MALTKTKLLDSEVALQMTGDFLEKFELCCNESAAPKSADLEKYLSKNFNITSNGKTIAKSLNEYMSVVAGFQKKYSHVEISDLETDVLASGYQIVARYRLYLTSPNGQKLQIAFMAIATLEDHHFISWNEVASELGADNWLP